MRIVIRVSSTPFTQACAAKMRGARDPSQITCSRGLLWTLMWESQPLLSSGRVHARRNTHTHMLLLVLRRPRCCCSCWGTAGAAAAAAAAAAGVLPNTSRPDERSMSVPGADACIGWTAFMVHSISRLRLDRSPLHGAGSRRFLPDFSRQVQRSEESTVLPCEISRRPLIARPRVL